MRRRRAVLVLALAMIAGAGRAGAGEIGHYAAGLANIRDLAMPDPRFYGIVYNYSPVS